jgi:hypothetical protein
LEGFASFAAQAEGKRLAVFLDYDGTLTPIVKNPDRAFMSDQVRPPHVSAQAAIAGHMLYVSACVVPLGRVMF